MATASGWLDAGILEEDAVGADGWIRGSKSGGGDGGGYGVSEWSGVIGLEVWGGESKLEKS